MATAGNSNDPELPNYSRDDFSLTNPLACDMIMKGGVTSGIVYPYAILEIATKYRLKSLGGTSAGAIAAAFAAAAEYARQNGRPEGFLILKQYCDELPEKLLSLFQPSPKFAPLIDLIKALAESGGLKGVPKLVWAQFSLGAVIGGISLGLPSYLFQSSHFATGLAILLGVLVGGAAGSYFWAKRKVLDPISNAFESLPKEQFGICPGLTQEGASGPGLTDWLHGALQHIAFGDPNHPKPLTFGDLTGSDATAPGIDLKVVTTNLSMRRPHTLPFLGAAAGFIPKDWERLFPKSVMDFLYTKGTKRWARYQGAWLFPNADNLPVLVGVRMSLSFPLLFSAVPLIMEDKELPAIVKSLGGKPYKRFRKVHFSDGGISSNFPIHMFDQPLPSRPTFAFSLEELLWDPNEVSSRVVLPLTASEGMGVQIKVIKSVADFGWQILNSAKDWQDQLLSEITGQRERIVRIFLSKSEGGLNLSMAPEVSRQLMSLGAEAGRKFADGEFNFDEHKWRRVLVLHRHLSQNLEAIEKIWSDGFGDWYQTYYKKVKSYKKLTHADRLKISADLDSLIAQSDAASVTGIVGADDKFPKKVGILKVGPKF